MPVIPAPGQIWRDPRNPAREVLLITVNSCNVHARNTKTGRRSWIKRENFTAIAILRNRWIFVRDAPGERAKIG